MMDWTDRHCRFFHRLLTRQALLYTEMVTTGALLHGDIARHLDFDPHEHPLALQLGGSEPEALADCARLAQRWGYDEVNLNCGCPSERVQRGAFGACLMAEPQLVADCVKAMRDACNLPVTVKHRIGLDRNESYDFLAEFVSRVSQAGCNVFIVHARNAWLKGLSPKENREVPPLRYEVVAKLKQDFPQLTIVLNGGLTDWGPIKEQLKLGMDGVMVGRKAYHEPYWLAAVDQQLFGDQRPAPDRFQVLESMLEYIQNQQQQGVAARSITRHLIGLFNGLPRARIWRQRLSDPVAMNTDPIGTIRSAVAILQREEYDYERFNQGNRSVDD